MSAKIQKQVTLGRVSGVFGVKGWLKVLSYTEPRENIVRLGPWILRSDDTETVVEVEDGREHGGGQVVAKLRGLDDRDRAREWIGAEIVVPRERLPALAEGEYYWTDLEGLEVVTTAGQLLGRVDHLLATGAHDVLVLAGHAQQMIPFVVGPVVRDVDLDGGRIVVDWSPDY